MIRKVAATIGATFFAPDFRLLFVGKEFQYSTSRTM